MQSDNIATLNNSEKRLSLERMLHAWWVTGTWHLDSRYSWGGLMQSDNIATLNNSEKRLSLERMLHAWWVTGTWHLDSRYSWGC